MKRARLAVLLMGILLVSLLTVQVTAGPWNCTLTCCGETCEYTQPQCGTGGCMHNEGYTYCQCICGSVITTMDCR
jgi:hypothetical protein